jgi:ABC-type nitrate/sulfonate/bicarbonate transport system permease component
MNRWAVRRYVRLRSHLADRGQTSFEYLGIAVVIAVIIGVLAGTTSIGTAVLNAILDKITAIAGAGG